MKEQSRRTLEGCTGSVSALAGYLNVTRACARQPRAIRATRHALHRCHPDCTVQAWVGLELIVLVRTVPVQVLKAERGDGVQGH